MANDEIRDLMGRYATGSLSDQEQKVLFDAALGDQELFDEIAREHDVKTLLAEPGARNRMIRALEPPPRKAKWFLALAATAALSAVLMVFLLRPAPRPQQQVAVATTPPPVAEAPVTPAPAPTAAEVPPAAPEAKQEEAPRKVADASSVAAPERRDAPAPPPKNEPAGAPARVRAKEADQPADEKLAKQKDEAVDQLARAESKSAESSKKDAAPAAAAPPPPAPRVQSQQSAVALDSNSVGGPRQNTQQTNQQARTVNGVGAAGGLLALPPFGFHYSIETKGHLLIIPAADGYLSVKAADGSVLYATKAIAAGSPIDIAVPDSARSLAIVFSVKPPPVQATPMVRTALEDTVQGVGAVAVDLKLNP